MGFKDEAPIYGITFENAWENLLTYSVFAAQSLDFAAGAASGIDLEAGRFFRMAQNFLRARVDLLLTQLVFGEVKKVEDKVLRLKLNARPFEPFGGITLATSNDKAEMRKDASVDLLEDPNLDYSMGGDLIKSVRSVIDAERAFLIAPIELIARGVTGEQRTLLEELQRTAATVEGFLTYGIHLLKVKLRGERSQFFCNCCGTVFLLPEEEGCPVCKAPVSAISPLPFAPIGNLKELYGS